MCGGVLTFLDWSVLCVPDFFSVISKPSYRVRMKMKLFSNFLNQTRKNYLSCNNCLHFKTYFRLISVTIVKTLKNIRCDTKINVPYVACINRTVTNNFYDHVSLYLQIIIAIRRKRRLDRLRHSLIPFYSFDANEEEDWDSDLLQHENGTPTIRVSRLFYQYFYTCTTRSFIFI